MARKQALGRGLDALIPAGPEIRPGVLELPIEAIGPNPRQPRTQFSNSELRDLTDSIRQHGILQPFHLVRYLQLRGDAFPERVIKALDVGKQVQIHRIAVMEVQSRQGRASGEEELIAKRGLPDLLQKPTL